MCSGPLILVCEDETLIALAMEEALQEAGYRTLHVASLAQAREAPVFDVAAAVVNLRYGDTIEGQDIIRFLRGRLDGLPAVVVTGYGPDAPEADLRGLGGPTHRLHKPDHMEELVAAVRVLIDERLDGRAPPPRQRRGE